MTGQSSSGPKTTSFLISLIANLVMNAFGSRTTVLNPSFSTPIWNIFTALPFVGGIIAQYGNPNLMLAIVSFAIVWLAGMYLLSKLGGLFGIIVILIMAAVITAFMLGLLNPTTILQRIGNYTKTG